MVSQMVKGMAGLALDRGTLRYKHLISGHFGCLSGKLVGMECNHFFSDRSRSSLVRSSRIARSSVATVATLLFTSFSMAAFGQKPFPMVPAVTPPVQVSNLFESKIRPLLLASCVGCHGKDGPQGGLRLDAPINLEKAREVLRRVKGEGGKPRMPLGSTLAADKMAALEEWVRQGAQWPAGGAISAPGVMSKGKNHWAFQPLRRPAVPHVKDVAWARNSIDAFILKRLDHFVLNLAAGADGGWNDLDFG